MPFSLSLLFKAKAADSSSDGLTQPQREAIVDLLHLCMYADNLIALAESKVVTEAVDSFAWETQTSFESYETRSVSSAREAKESQELKQSLLDSISQRLATPNSRAIALKLCKQLLTADGITEKESSLLAKVKLTLS